MRTRFLAVMVLVVVMLPCALMNSARCRAQDAPKADNGNDAQKSSSPKETPKADSGGKKAKPSTDAKISEALKSLFTRLDELGLAGVKDAKPVELTLVNVEHNDNRETVRGWVIAEDNDSITVLEDDLIPWTYAKHDSTMIPASWNPATVKLESVKELDAEALFKRVVEEKVDPKRQ